MTDLSIARVPRVEHRQSYPDTHIWTTTSLPPVGGSIQTVTATSQPDIGDIAYLDASEDVMSRNGADNSMTYQEGHDNLSGQRNSAPQFRQHLHQPTLPYWTQSPRQAPVGGSVDGAGQDLVLGKHRSLDRCEVSSRAHKITSVMEDLASVSRVENVQKIDVTTSISVTFGFDV